VDEHGRPLGAAQIERVKALAIPPAWSDVWVCPDERGHLQAVGTDDAGRRQYLYHPEWRRKRDAEKFDRAIELGRRLPRVRASLHDAMAGDPADRSTVVAAAVRLLDLGCFRLGSGSSAEENGSFGLTTLQVRHVHRGDGKRIFRFVGKSGIDHEIVVTDPEIRRIVDALTAHRRRDATFLAARDGRTWRAVNAGEVNELIRALSGLDVTAKDFRTWKATVRVAVELAGIDRADSASRRLRQVRSAVGVAADLLGNTLAVARASYVDPRVVDLFEDGTTMRPARSEDGIDRAVVGLLTR